MTMKRISWPLMRCLMMMAGSRSLQGFKCVLCLHQGFSQKGPQAFGHQSWADGSAKKMQQFLLGGAAYVCTKSTKTSYRSEPTCWDNRTGKNSHARIRGISGEQSKSRGPCLDLWCGTCHPVTVMCLHLFALFCSYLFVLFEQQENV